MENPASSSADPLPASQPLLPAVLLNAGSHLWLWALPVGVLGLLNLHGYWLVGSELNEEQQGRALLLGLANLVNLLAGLAVYGLAKFSKPGSWTPDTGHPAWGLPGVLVQAGYLWLAMSSLNAPLLPANITAWIYPEGRFVFNQFAFCMLPAFHGILRLAAARPPVASGRAIAVNLGLAVGSPILLFVFIHTVLSFGEGHFGELRAYVFATLAVVLGVLMFVGLVRALLIIFRLTQKWHATGERWAVVLIALGFPLAGLTLNRSIPFPVDFQATEVYVLTVANALILLFAVWTGTSRPRLSWHLLCVTFPFALYFFIVFLPFTPLSILAVIVMGAGLLVLTPTLLFALHLHLLGKAWRLGLVDSSRRGLLMGGALAVLALPAFFTVRGLADKTALNAALDYLYTPSVKGGDLTYGSSLANLRRAVDSHRDYKDGLYYPILSDYYAWLVFDNLVLPDGKLAEIEQTFFGPAGSGEKLDPYRKDFGIWGRGRASDRKRMRAAPPPPKTVETAPLRVRTQPADARNTTVTLALTLSNPGPVAAEYEKTLALPAGVFVSGFRLQVGDTLVPGRIFEKKTALWVYSMIRDTERRDPGILYYRAPGELELRVYPVLTGKPIAVEIDFLVPAVLSAEALAESATTIDSLLAGISRLMPPGSTQGTQGDRVVSGLAARDLPTVEFEPYLHIIVDRSAGNGFTGDFAAAVATLKQRYPQARLARVTAANYDVTGLITDLTELDRLPGFDAQQLHRIMPLSGGMALDLALAHAIREHRDHDLDGAAAGQSPRQPVFVILSRKAEKRALVLPLTEAWSDLLPSLELGELGEDGGFVAHAQTGRWVVPWLRCGASVRPLAQNRVTRFSGGSRDERLQYWAPERNAWQDVEEITVHAGDSVWSQAVALHLLQQDHERSPGDAVVDRRNLIRASRESGILLSISSYIVVENQAQWKMLETGERQKLGQNQALEFLETPAPPALWVVLGFSCWLAWRRWRNGRLRSAALFAASSSRRR